MIAFLLAYLLSMGGEIYATLVTREHCMGGEPDVQIATAPVPALAYFLSNVGTFFAFTSPLAAIASYAIGFRRLA